MPLNTLYSCGIANPLWVVTNRKPERSRDEVQLIDATDWFRPPRMSWEKTNGGLGPQDIETICRTSLDFE